MHTVYLISDGTAETASVMVRAALVQYPNKNINVILNKNVRTEEQVELLLQQVEKNRGFIVHTIVGDQLRSRITEMTIERRIPCVDLLGALLSELNRYLGVSSGDNQVGILRTVNKHYFKRIEAIEYTVKHDDGKTVATLEEADIVLVGVSRTSKTPLSIFLSHKGWKVANIPLVLESPPPESLFQIDQRKIVGLIINEESLYRIRRQRLTKFGQDPGSKYASRDYIAREIENAKTLFKKNRRWPIFDVTDRALEETASEILRIIAIRMNISHDPLF